MYQNTLSNETYQKRSVDKDYPIRGNYFRDQTAIVHSMPFRRLKHKTQVFYAPTNDHVCTRIEHVMHVATIASSICKGLNNSKEWNLDIELAFAIGLGHDLGHAPFGHNGEDALNKLNGGRNAFVHEINSYRVVEHLANNGKGLNLTYAVKDGIICHNGENFEKELFPEQKENDLENIHNRNCKPSSYEGCIVRFSDKIAYLGRDIEDAIVAGFINKDDIPIDIAKNIGSSNGEIIDYLVRDIIVSSNDGFIRFSDDSFNLIKELKKFNYSNIYGNQLLNEHRAYGEKIIETLFHYLFELFNKNEWNADLYLSQKHISLIPAFGHYIHSMQDFYMKEKNEKTLSDELLKKQIITDYISGMTDLFAIECMKQISLPFPLF